jgi:GNAT superfamily N-acetyltransferase
MAAGMIRRATSEDAAEVSRVFVAARDEMSYLPPVADEHRPLLGGWFLERWPTWVAEEAGDVVGFLSLHGSTVEQLYVEPGRQNQGVGIALLDQAKALSPERLELWVFQANEGARRFYERHGFRLVELTDGLGNMEKEPDARYEWTSGA